MSAKHARPGFFETSVRLQFYSFGCTSLFLPLAGYVRDAHALHLKRPELRKTYTATRPYDLSIVYEQYSTKLLCTRSTTSLKKILPVEEH